MDTADIKNDVARRVLESLSTVLHGKNDALLRILVCVFSSGHMLLEDLPGLGKTTMAIAVAHVLGLRYGRIQCTNDLLPTDVTGLNIFKADRGEFEFHPGPIFNNLVLVDEINRATPKTQSALLEAMGEEQTTIDGRTYKLARPFFVIATQNPIEHAGTFPLPESQMDRFMMRVRIGYPDRESERDILRQGGQRQAIEEIPPQLSADDILAIQREIDEGVNAGDKILDYVLTLVEQTRHHPLLATGISTRGAMVLLQCAKCVAWLQGRDFTIPEDVKAFADDILSHRIILKNGSQQGTSEILHAIMTEIPAL